MDAYINSVVVQKKTRPRLKHTAKPMKISPVRQCRNVDDCRVHICGPRGTCVDGVSSHSCDYDLGFPEADIDGDKLCENFDDCGACSVARAMETRCVRESDTSYQCGKARVRTSSLVKVATRLVGPYTDRGEERFSDMTITFAVIQIR